MGDSINRNSSGYLPAQEDAVFGQLVEWLGWDTIVQNGFDPKRDFRLDELVSLTSVLVGAQEHEATVSKSIGHNAQLDSLLLD